MNPIQQHGRTLLLSLLIVVFSVGMSLPLAAQDTLEITEGNSWFEGTSTVRDWACKTVPMSGSMDLEDDHESAKELLNSASEDTLSATVSVPTKEIRCEQGEKMNKHMRNALETDEYESIEYRVEKVESVQAPDEGADTYTVNVKGTLTISGDERAVPLTLSAVPQPDKSLRLVGSKDLNIKKFGVKPPTVMWTITVYKDITVHLDVFLK